MKVELQIPPDIPVTWDPKRRALVLEPVFYRGVGNTRDLAQAVVSGSTDRRVERVLTINGKDGVLSVAKTEPVIPLFDRADTGVADTESAVDSSGDEE